MGQTRTIGALSPVVGGTHYGRVLTAISRAVTPTGHRVLAIQTLPAELERGEVHEPPPLDVATGVEACAGIVALPGATSEERLRALSATGRPLVLVSLRVEGVDAPSVQPDNANLTREAVEHLLGHGHTRIGFVGDQWHQDQRQRYLSWVSTLRAHGIEPGEDWYLEASDSLEPGGAGAARRLLASGSTVTAIIAATDRNALGVMQVMTAAGKSLPADLAIVGVDNLEEGALASPALTSIDTGLDQIGQRAGELMVQLLAGEVVGPGPHVVPGSLVIRESCGCSSVTPHTSDAGKALELMGIADDVAVTSPLSTSSRDAIRSSLERATEAFRCFREGADLDTAQLTRCFDEVFAQDPPGGMATQMLAALRALEAVDTTSAPDGGRAHTEALTALFASHTRALHRQRDTIERWLTAQYEIDMELLRRGHANPRHLAWISAAGVTGACLGLWSGPADATGDRPLEVAGTYDRDRALSPLVGTLSSASQFPPQAFRDFAASAEDQDLLIFLLPVRTDSSRPEVLADWGLLAIIGHVEGTSPWGRGRYNHWAALVAVALDQQQLLESIARQRTALEEAYAREKALVLKVKASEERYALAATAAQDGVWDWDVSTGEVYFSERCKAMLGYQPDEVRTDPSDWFDRVHPEDRDELSAAIAAQLGGSTQPLRIEHRVRAADGGYRWLLCQATTVLDDVGAPSRIVGAMSDVGDRRRLEAELRQNALYDTATGLANRMLFTDHVESAIARTRRVPDYDFSVVFFVVDQLDRVHEAHGREGGDQLLQQLGSRMRATVRGVDTAGRVGDDSFAVVLDGLPAKSTERFLRRLFQELTAPYGVGDEQVTLTVGMGVPHSGRDYSKVDDLLHDAQVSMYRMRVDRPAT